MFKELPKEWSDKLKIQAYLTELKFLYTKKCFDENKERDAVIIYLFDQLFDKLSEEYEK
jgi:hypothetical protein